MRRRSLLIAAPMKAMAPLMAVSQKGMPPQALERIHKEGRHEILVLP